MNIFQKNSSRKQLKKIKDMARIEALWGKTRTAEERGDLVRAIEIQERIVLLDASTYASVCRLASLYCRNANYDRALDCYQKAWDISEERNWPLQGMRDCYQAMGDSDAVRQIERRLREWGHAVSEQRIAG